LIAFAGIVFIVALGVAFVRSPEPVKAAADERNFDSKAAAKVVLKSQIHEYLDWPKVERMGGRAFIVGHRVNAPGSVWLPVDDVLYIESYYNLDDMLKVYPGLPPKKDQPAKPDGMVKVAPDAEPKKN